MQVHKYRYIPDPQEVAPGVFSVPISQPFYAPNNVYIIKSEEPTLIDSGYIENLGMLQRALRKIGLGFRDIRHVFYTHEHIDHISGALSLRFYTQAKFYAMAGLLAECRDYTGTMAAFERAGERLIYKAHGDADERRAELERQRKAWKRFYDNAREPGKQLSELQIDIELVEGDVIDVGGREIGFLHTPGHNKHHLTPYILGEGLYFTGDLVLENVSAVYAELDGNLSDYYRSLERLLRLPVKRLLPAHGEEPADPHKRIKLIHKTLKLLERGVARRLREEGERDLKELALEAMGEKVRSSSHYVTAIATIHSMLLALVQRGQVGVREVDPPYERYFWIGDGRSETEAA